MNEASSDSGRIRDYYEKAWSAEAADESTLLVRMRREANVRALNSVLDEAARLRPASILEIGPGEGVATRKFAAAGHRVTTLDLARSSLESLRGVSRPSQGDLSKLPFRENSFSIVFVNSVLMFTQLENSLGEIRKVLKPGGLAVLLEPLAGNPFLRIYRAIDGRYRGIAAWHGYDALVARAREKLNSVEVEPFYFLIPLAVLSGPFRAALALDRLLLRFIPQSAWLVLIRGRK